jgi:hypothetical protein
MARAKYEVDGQYVDVWYDDPWTSDRYHERYWVATKGGYVRLDHPPFNRPGTLGNQPTDRNGSTWMAKNVPDMLAQIKASIRRDRRLAAKT